MTPDTIRQVPCAPRPAQGVCKPPAAAAVTGAPRRRRTAPGGPCPDPRARAPAVSAPQRLAIEAPRPSLADLRAIAAEHGYVVIRPDREG
jgi:hypothetical protein